jgi:hypothetical protein
MTVRLKITETERQIFRNMTPADKFRLISEMHMQAREWKRAAFKVQHSDWSDEQIGQRVREVFLYGAS